MQFETLQDALKAYREKFGEGPPIWQMPEAEAIAMIEKAIADNKPVHNLPEQDVPEGYYL